MTDERCIASFDVMVEKAVSYVNKHYVAIGVIIHMADNYDDYEITVNDLRDLKSAKRILRKSLLKFLSHAVKHGDNVEYSLNEDLVISYKKLLKETVKKLRNFMNILTETRQEF